MSNIKAISIPLAAHFKLLVALFPIDATAKGLISSIPYESAVGSIIYLMVCTRPNITYAIGKVSRYMSNFKRMHKLDIYTSKMQFSIVHRSWIRYGNKNNKKTIWLNKFAIEMELPHSIMNLYFDIKSAFHLASNNVMDGRVKHIDIRYH